MSRETQKENVELVKQVQFLEATNKSQLEHIRALVMANEILEERLKEKE